MTAIEEDGGGGPVTIRDVYISTATLTSTTAPEVIKLFQTN